MAIHPEGDNLLRGGSATHAAKPTAFNEVWEAWSPPSGGIKVAANDEPAAIKLPTPANDLKVHTGVKDGKPFTVTEEPDYFSNGGK